MSKALVLKGTDFSVNKLDTVIVADPIPCTGISLSASTASVEAGKAVTLTATVTPNDTTDSIVWSSSNNSLATVENGVVTAISSGSVTITATCGNYSATCAITVFAYYTEAILGRVLGDTTRCDYVSAYGWIKGGTFNDPFFRKLTAGQTISARAREGSQVVAGLYLYMFVYTAGTFTDKCTQVGDDYVLTQAMLDMQSTDQYGILINGTRIYNTGDWVSNWSSSNDYTATQDCYVAFFYNIDGSSDISSDINAIKNRIKIEVT